jgi:hypothetical protein
MAAKGMAGMDSPYEWELAQPRAVNHTGQSTWTPPPEDPLIDACRHGRTAEVEALIAGGHDIHIQSLKRGEQRSTPLYVASWEGHGDVVDVLLKAPGINTKLGNSGLGATPLWAACNQGHAEIAQKLLAAGADVCLKATNASCPLYISIAQGHLECVKVVSAAGANRNIDRGYRPENLAAIEGNKDNQSSSGGKVLNQERIDEWKKMARTAEQLARRLDHREIADWLRDNEPGPMPTTVRRDRYGFLCDAYGRRLEGNFG